jgi:hypothetical protein
MKSFISSAIAFGTVAVIACAVVLYQNALTETHFGVSTSINL